MCGQGGLLTLKMRKYVIWQDPASSLHCLAILILEFLSTGHDLQSLTLGRAASVSFLSPFSTFWSHPVWSLHAGGELPLLLLST